MVNRSMIVVTRKTVDAYLESGPFAAYETNGTKGVYERAAGPAHSFRGMGKTWRAVYIALLVAENTKSADEKLARMGVSR